jgi:hypothetical protein
MNFPPVMYSMTSSPRTCKSTLEIAFRAQISSPGIRPVSQNTNPRSLEFKLASVSPFGSMD